MNDDAVTPEPDPLPGPSAEAEPAAPAPGLPAPRFDTQPYYVYNPPAPTGALLLLTGMSVAGFLVGLIASVISHWLYLVVIFPIGMGVVLGGIGSFLVKFGKARAKFVLWSAGAIAGLATMFGLHVGYFVSELNELEGRVPGVRAVVLRDPTAFFRFLDMRAERGVVIGKGGQADKNLGYEGSYVYWVFEMGLIGYIAFIIFSQSAATPLCERCQGWKSERYLGRMTPVPAELVTGPLLDGDLLTLVDRATVTDDVCLRFKATFCPACGPLAPVDVTLERLAPNEKGHIKTSVLEQVRYPGDVLPLLDARRERA
jgi:hypothetical protein